MSAERPPRLAVALVLRALLGGVVILALTSTAIASAVLLKVDDFIPKGPDAVPTAVFEPSVLTKAEPGAPQTLLVVGTDRRYGAKKGQALADTIMLIRLDPRQEATAVLNVPRDLVTEIPGLGRRKINAAYGRGGLNLVVKAVKAKLGLAEINHAMAVDFKGFREVVNALDCIYTDVDRRYFNDNEPVTGGGEPYAVIDVKPGYQRLCGQRALEYVRYRHDDSTFGRDARQQGFLRDAKDQIATSTLLDNLDELVDIFGRSTQTDPGLREAKQVLRLLEQAAFSVGKPVRKIAFPRDDAQNDALGDYLVASDRQIVATRERFLAATAARPLPRKPKAVRSHPPTGKPAPRTTLEDFGLVDAKRVGQEAVAPVEAGDDLSIPVFFPQGLTPRGRWTGTPPRPRVYELRDRAGKAHEAYRLVFTESARTGDYYGVQGTTWKSPPILAGRGERLQMRGRTYRLFYDGQRLRVVAWQTASATYWVSNTLRLALTNTEMLGIARSLTRGGT